MITTLNAVPAIRGLPAVKAGTVPISNFLPRDARDALIAAAAVDPYAQPGESRNRACELDEAIKRVKLKYPEYFKHDKE